ILSQLSSLVSAACSNYGQNCPEDAPCCNNGWCSNDPKFCSTVQFCVPGCEPENSFSPKSCFPEPPCVSLYDDFSKPSLVNWQNFTGDPTAANWTSDFTPDYTTYMPDGTIQLSMKYDGKDKNAQGNYQGFGSTVSSTRWMEYGTVTARIKTGSTAKGVVSSFITKNLVGDEIDYEWVGLNPNEVQSNYYYNGTLDYTKVNQKDTWDDQLGQFKFPSRPSRIQFSMWDGGMGPPGTANWAGSPTDWSDQSKVYSMYVDWVNITCFYNGNSSTTWPPDGYGPTKKPNATSDSQSYATLGAGLPINLAAPGTNGSQIVPSTPNYDQPTSLPKLVAPVAALCSVTVLAAAGYGFWRYRRGSRVYTTQPYVKQMY
ncbi:4662_t:CDS:2, partial [Ambispora leptoticha]